MESTRNKLIQLLAEKNGQYVSGQYLSDKLSISRTAIWKHMKALEKDGYEIEGKSKKGYRITTFPDKVSENTITWGLDTKWIAKKIVYKEEVTSTQHVAHQLANDNAPHGTIVITDCQTQGKGRLNRKWYSQDEKGIWMSILLRPDLRSYEAPQLTLLAATVLADVLSGLLNNNSPISLNIKWPNDILLNKRKMAGILTEMQAEQDQVQYVVIGMGINLNQTKEDIHETIEHKATSLRIETGNEWARRETIQQILRTFETAYDNFLQTGFAPVKKKWEGYGFKIGQAIQINTAGEVWKAIFHGIAEDGALIVRTIDGDTKRLYSAEIDWFDTLEPLS